MLITTHVGMGFLYPSCSWLIHTLQMTNYCIKLLPQPSHILKSLFRLVVVRFGRGVEAAHRTIPENEPLEVWMSQCTYSCLTYHGRKVDLPVWLDAPNLRTNICSTTGACWLPCNKQFIHYNYLPINCKSYCMCMYVARNKIRLVSLPIKLQWSKCCKCHNL